MRSFVADQCTLEYDLAYYGLAREVFIAGRLAEVDERIGAGRLTLATAFGAAARAFAVLPTEPPEVLAAQVYALFAGDAFKAVAAQYLAVLLERDVAKGRRDAVGLRASLPSYLVGAIDYATGAPA